MAVGLHIDAENNTIKEVKFSGTSDIHRLIGGYLELAYCWENGDTLYVDEEGLLKNPKFFFSITERDDQMFAGNGLIVGKEIGDTSNTKPPTINIRQLAPKINFYR